MFWSFSVGCCFEKANNYTLSEKKDCKRKPGAGSKLKYVKLARGGQKRLQLCTTGVSHPPTNVPSKE